MSGARHFLFPPVSLRRHTPRTPTFTPLRPRNTPHTPHSYPLTLSEHTAHSHPYAFKPSGRAAYFSPLYPYASGTHRTLPPFRTYARGTHHTLPTPTPLRSRDAPHTSLPYTPTPAGRTAHSQPYALTRAPTRIHYTYYPHSTLGCRTVRPQCGHPKGRKRHASPPSPPRADQPQSTDSC